MNKEEMMNKIAKMECEIEYLKKELNKQEEPKKSRWKPEKNYEEYYCISTTGDVVKCLVFKNDNIDNQNYEFHNMFKTKEEAEFTVEQRKVLAELKEYADDKEWDGDNWHWCIEYNANEKRMKVDYYWETKIIPFNIYFSSEEQAQKAIDAIGEERLKKYYFCVEE